MLINSINLKKNYIEIYKEHQNINFGNLYHDPYANLNTGDTYIKKIKQNSLWEKKLRIASAKALNLSEKTSGKKSAKSLKKNPQKDLTLFQNYLLLNVEAQNPNEK